MKLINGRLRKPYETWPGGPAGALETREGLGTLGETPSDGTVGSSCYTRPMGQQDTSGRSATGEGVSDTFVAQLMEEHARLLPRLPQMDPEELLNILHSKNITVRTFIYNVLIARH